VGVPLCHPSPSERMVIKMENIRVRKGIPIEVNDDGETIVMNAESQGFIEKFYGLIEKIDNVSKDMQSEEVQQLGEREQIQKMIAKTKTLMQEIDDMFGPESCRKIFGNIVPSPYLIAEFFEQLEPIAQRYVDERQKEIAKKYSSKRKGARTSKYRTKEQIIQDAMR